MRFSCNLIAVSLSTAVQQAGFSFKKIARRPDDELGDHQPGPKAGSVILQRRAVFLTHPVLPNRDRHQLPRLQYLQALRFAI
jgi:hypothetical protein